MDGHADEAVDAGKPIKPKKEKQAKAKADGKVRRSGWDPPPFKVPPRLWPGESSMIGLPDRQENEFVSIKEIFPGAVEELPVGRGCQSSEEENEEEPEAYRPSTPVKRYRVRLAASTGSGGPTAELEVSYGRLYPSETPRLLVDKVDNLAKEAWVELTRRVGEEVDQAAGQECVFQVCSAITELLRAYHDPSAEIPLFERMQRREAEEAKQKEEAARQGRAEAQKKAMEDWEKQKQAERQRMERYEEKRRAAARVGDGGGTLDFLPEDSELGTCAKGKKEQGVQPHPMKDKPEVVVNPKVVEKNSPRAPASFEPDVSSRFKGGGRVRAFSDDSSDCGTLPSFSDGLSLGAFEFVVDVQEEQPPAKQPQLIEKALPKAKPKTSPKMLPAMPRVQATPQPRAAAAVDKKVESEAVSSLAAVGRYATDFEELRFLGKGGFGFVTKARHRVDRQLYAVKRLELRGSAVDRERLLQECALLPRLTHLNIVRYYQAWIETEQVEPAARPTTTGAPPPKGRGAAKKRAVRTVKPEIPAERDDWLSHNGPARARGASPPPGSVFQREFLYIQMEFCDGTTLREAIGSGVLQKDEALIWKLFRQVLDALAYMHSRGLIHRDVKPPNIFLSKAEGGHAKLGDFGLSTELASLEPAPEAAGTGSWTRQQSTGVGTALYMAPEVRGGHSLSRGSSLQLYDNRADMFSLGVVFFEMWRPPFGTAMERVDVLGKLALPISMSSEPIKDLANMPKEFLQKVQERLPEAPPEATKILASLLQEDPEARFTADHLLNRSGLLPSGAFDPQVQRVLSALEDPSSSESVALLQALFSRIEEPAKDIPFFEQLFRFAEQGVSSEGEAEVRDALLQLFREVCRRHGAVHDLCPLLRPAVRAESGALSPGGAVLSKGPSMPAAVRLVDAGNTLVELRANLTEPFIRALSARHGARRAQAEGVEDSEPLAAVSQQLRRYHVGTVYREAPSSELYAQSQFGHPREVSSAVVQFLWQPQSGQGMEEEYGGRSPLSRSITSRSTQRHTSHFQEAEHLHMLAELFSSASMAGRVSLHLSDTRLLRLLQEVAYHRAVREVNAGSVKKPSAPGAGKAPQPEDRASTGERLRARLLEALKLMAAGDKQGSSQSGSSSGYTSHVVSTAPAIPHAALERAASELASLLGGAAGSPEAPKAVSTFVSEVEELYAVPSTVPPGSPAGSQNVTGAGRAASLEPQAAAAEELSEVLRSLRMLDAAISPHPSWRAVHTDPHIPVNAMYGPGLVFSVKMHALDKKEPTMVCVGGRVDHLARQYALLHSPKSGADAVFASESLALGTAGSDDLCAMSAELAVDKLANGLVQLAQGAGNTSSSRQRGKSTLPAFTPWWRQAGRQAACWPSVLLGPASSEDRFQASFGDSHTFQLHTEALHAAAGLRRWGASCQLWPPGAGMIDARVVSDMQKNVAMCALEGVCGPHDFIVTLTALREEEKKVDEDDAARRDKNDKKKSDDNKSAKKEKRPEEDDSERKIVIAGIRFFLHALSDQGHEAMERAAKDAGGSSRSFDGRQSLLDFFERLTRRHAANVSRTAASS